MRKNRTIDLVSCGELLIDMISADFAETMAGVENFKRIPGGSPANLCMNMARLGGNTQLVASVGQDDMGAYLLNYVQSLGFHCETVRQVAEPTTLILVTRSRNVSNFEAYRGADCQIGSAQLPEKLLRNTKIFHTTCFGLSLKPAQTNILKAAERAVEYGCRLSIDANYSPKIWPNQSQALKIVSEYVSNGAFVKISEVDWERLYGSKLTDPNEAADRLLALGAGEVCVTLGADGCLVANAEARHFVPSRPVDVKDTTGAGDAFWSGYLTARLDGHPIERAALAGRRMAELKLGHFGPLPNRVSREIIYEDFL